MAPPCVPQGHGALGGHSGGRLRRTSTKRPAHDALARLLSRLELGVLRVEVAAGTGVETDPDPASGLGLGVGEIGDAMGTHALRVVERLRQGFRLLSRRGLAAVGQEVPAVLVGGLETSRARVYTVALYHPLAVGVGEVRHPMGTHALRVGQHLGLVAAAHGETSALS